MLKGAPSSVLRVKAEDDTAFRTLNSRQEGQAREHYRFMEIGTYDIRDGSFDLTLDEGDRTSWAEANSLRFVPLRDGAEALPAERQSELDAQLRALGYLGG